MAFGSLVPWRDKSNVPAKDQDFGDPFLNFRREVDRLFDEFFRGSPPRGVQPRSDWQELSPVIDVEDSELVVTAELPGLDAKDFEVTLVGDFLTIKGEKKVENENRDGGSHYVERRFGSFSRSVRLPFEASDQQVDAKYDRGVLRIRVPKPAEAQRQVKRIEVTSD